MAKLFSGSKVRALLALGSVASIAWLSGCGGHRAGVDPSALPGAGAPLASSALSISGEAFVATKVFSHCRHGDVLQARFHASGNATGPLPGTFTAFGAVKNGGLIGSGQLFEEHFTIESGTHTITGTARQRNVFPNCSRGSAGQLVFDSDSLHYRIEDRHSKGTSTVDMRNGSFSESFQ